MKIDKLKESKKILTDYMLELNADIQRAEEWANTSADEEMYFAIKHILQELEDNQADLTTVYIKGVCDEKSKWRYKIREKMKELDKQYKEYVSKWEKTEMNKQHPFYAYITRLEAQIDILQELLEESN